MKLTAPIYRLKRQAKTLSRTQEIPLHEALNRIAREQGFASWSLLASRLKNNQPARTILSELTPGDLVLLAARPGQGKTLLGLELAIEAMKVDQRSLFFTLEFNKSDVQACFDSLGERVTLFGDRFVFDDSDEISAAYIIARLHNVPRGTLVVVDYLQALDQKRENPEIMAQVTALRDFASRQGLIIVFISQIHRSYDPGAGSMPGLRDVRLPNPLDLKLFHKTCFLNDGEVEFAAVG